MSEEPRRGRPPKKLSCPSCGGVVVCHESCRVQRHPRDGFGASDAKRRATVVAREQQQLNRIIERIREAPEAVPDPNPQSNPEGEAA